MIGRHLTDDELDRLLAGDEIGREGEAHVANCLVCRHRRTGFLGAVEAARSPEPDEETLDRLREGAMVRWTGDRPGRYRWWLAAAAVFFLVVLLPLSRITRPQHERVDAEAILREVDAVLARDPLTAMAPEELVDAVIPSGESSTNGSAS